MLHNLIRTLIPSALRRPIARLTGFRHLQLGWEQPVNYRARSKRSIQDDVKYAAEIAKSYIDQVEGTGRSIRDARILELGPGHHFAPDLVLASYGAHVAVADRFLTKWDNRYHSKFYAAFQEYWREPLVAIDEVLAQRSHAADVIGMHPFPAEALTSIGNATQDVVLSNAVLEHVFSLSDVCREMARITAPGGFNIHQVDFRDHRDFSRPLEFLLLSDEVFLKQFHGSHGECGNRLRASEVCSTFQENGFELLNLEINERADADYLEKFLVRLGSSSSRFKSHPSSDLAILGARFTFRRR